MAGSRHAPVDSSRVCHGRVDVVQICVALAWAESGDGTADCVKHRGRQLLQEGTGGLVVHSEYC